MTVPRQLIGVGEFAVARGSGTLVTLGLGSCVAIVLYDPGNRGAGMAHVLLPSAAMSRLRDAPGRYPATAVPALVEALVDLGCDPARLTGRLVGGASMFTNLTPPGALQMGERNVLAAREALTNHGIPLIGELVGGDHGRSVTLSVDTGRLEVSSVRHGTEHL